MGTYSIDDPTSFKSVMASLQSNLNVKVDNVTEATSKAVMDITLDCLGRSVPLAPVDEGHLRNSGYATVNGELVAMGTEDGGIESLAVPLSAGDTTTGTVGYLEVYAHRQHEDTSLNHPKGGQAKYLESVILDRVDDWSKHIADNAIKGFKEG